MDVDKWWSHEFTLENIIKLHNKCTECRIGIPYSVFRILQYDNCLPCLKFLFDNNKGLKIENINSSYLNSIKSPFVLMEMVRQFEKSVDLLFRIALKNSMTCPIYYIMHNYDINAENQTLLMSRLVSDNNLKLQTYDLIKLLERSKSCNKYDSALIKIDYLDVGMEKLIALAVSGIMDYGELLTAFNIRYYCCKTKKVMTKKLVNFSIKYTISLPPCVITLENKKLVKLNCLYRCHFDNIELLLIEGGLIKDIANFIIEFL